MRNYGVIGTKKKKLLYITFLAPRIFGGNSYVLGKYAPPPPGLVCSDKETDKNRTV